MNLMNVVEQVSKVIALNDDVHAMWLEGSWATGKNNEHSDIDVWLDVKDGTFDKCIAIFRRILEDMGEVDWEKSRGIYSDSPKLQKHTFHLKGFT